MGIGRMLCYRCPMSADTIPTIRRHCPTYPWRDDTPTPIPPTDESTPGGTYRAPYHLHAPDPADRPTLQALAPTPTYPTLRAAAGVCYDAKRHMLGACIVLDADGVEVPEHVWGYSLRAAREAV